MDAVTSIRNAIGCMNKGRYRKREHLRLATEINGNGYKKRMSEVKMYSD
jgi:hypothetical protein